MNPPLQAIILLGGKGTRLSRMFPDRPKALIPVAGSPFLERQIAWLVRGGITKVHLAAGHLAEHLLAWLTARATAEISNPAKRGASTCPARGGIERSTLNAQVMPKSRQRHPADTQRLSRHKPCAPEDVGCWMLDVGRSGSALSITFSAEPRPLGTGGGLKYVETHIRSDPFLVLNGDSLLPQLDFSGLRHAHAPQHPGTTLAVTRLQETGRYGTIEFDAHQHIRAFHEKAERREGWVNGGVYLMNKQTLSLIDPGKEVSLETELFPRWAAQKQLYAFPVPPPLLDMGTPEGLEAMESYLTRQGGKDAKDGKVIAQRRRAR